MSQTIAPEFHLILADPCPDSTWEEPEDLSGILTEFENRWRRFCYECNHEVNCFWLGIKMLPLPNAIGERGVSVV